MTDRLKVTVRVSLEQHSKITEAANRLGMTINDYMVASALAREQQNDSDERAAERMDALESALVEAFEGQREATDAAIKEAVNATREGVARDLEKLVGWLDRRLPLGERRE